MVEIRATRYAKTQKEHELAWEIHREAKIQGEGKGRIFVRNVEP